MNGICAISELVRLGQCAKVTKRGMCWECQQQSARCLSPGCSFFFLGGVRTRCQTLAVGRWLIATLEPVFQGAQGPHIQEQILVVALPEQLIVQDVLQVLVVERAPRVLAPKYETVPKVTEPSSVPSCTL